MRLAEVPEAVCAERAVVREHRQVAEAIAELEVTLMLGVGSLSVEVEGVSEVARRDDQPLFDEQRRADAVAGGEAAEGRAVVEREAAVELVGELDRRAARQAQPFERARVTRCLEQDRLEGARREVALAAAQERPTEAELRQPVAAREVNRAAVVTHRAPIASCAEVEVAE